MIGFSCPQCGKALQVRDERPGDRVKCPQCGQVAMVPHPALAPAEPLRTASDVQSNPPPPLPGPAVREAATAPPGQPGQSARALDSFNGATQGEGHERLAQLTGFLAPPQAPDELGRLGPYRVLQVLGHGGMGVVFRAEDPQLKRPVALKAMLPALGSSDSARQRFLREAQAAAAIKHDHIVAIYQVGEDRGAPYLAMEFLEGEPLDVRLAREPCLPLAEVLRIGREVADGLQAAHERGLIHRDIKPANIWLEGKRRRAKILDFGLARVLGDRTQLTQDGAIIGTPAYMAPEQASGQAVDPRCDLFSLGCVLYRMATGQLPFQGKDTLAVLSALALATPPAPCRVNGAVPRELSDLVMQLLAKDPNDRPATAQVIAEALQHMEQDRTAAPALPPDATLLKPGAARARAGGTVSRSGRRLRWGAAVVGVLTLAAVAVYFITKPGGQAVVQPQDQGKSSGAVPAASNPLDLLDANNIPVAEREPGQPKELVAVLGSRHMRHGVNADSLVFALDGKVLVSKAYLNVIHLWDTSSLREKARIPGGYYDQLMVDRAGKTLAAISATGLAFWDLTGPEPRKIRGFPWPGGHRISGGAPALLSPDFSILALTQDNQSVQLWDMKAEPPKLKAGPNKRLDRILHFQFADDGKRLAVFTAGGVDLWDISGAEPKALPALAISQPLSLSADFTLLLSRLGGDGKCWDVTGAQPRLVGQFGLLAASRPTFTPDGKNVVQAVYGTVRILDLAGKEIFKDRMGGDSQGSNLFAFSRDRQLMALGVGNSIQVWDCSGPVPQRRTEISGGPVQPLFFPDCKRLLARDFLGVKLWDLTGPAPRIQTVLPLHGPSGSQYAGRIVLSPDGRILASEYTSTNLKGLRFWDLSRDEPQEKGDFKDVWGPMAFVGPGRTIAVGLGKSEGMVGLWDLNGDQPVARPPFQAQTQRVTDLAASADGKRLACWSSQANSVQLWDLSEPAPRKDMLIALPAKTKTTMIALSPDGKTLGTYTDGQAWFWDLSGPTPKRRGDILQPPAQRNYWAFAPNNRTVGMVHRDGGALYFSDALAATPPVRIALPWPVESFAFAADGRHLAVGNANGTVYILRLREDLAGARK